MPEQEVTESFIDTLPEDIKSQFTAEDIADVNVNKYKTLPDFIKGHRNLAPMISAKGLIIPKDTDPPEAWDSVFNTLGRPEKADGYKLTEVKGLHPSIKITPEGAKEFFDTAHKLGFTSKQADGLHQWYLGKMNTAIIANEKATTDKKAADDKAWNDKVVAGETALKQKWGADYDKRLVITKEFVGKKGGQALIDALGETATNPIVLDFLYNEGVKYAEDNVGNAGIKVAAGANADALAKIKAIREDKTHPWHKSEDPKHKEALAEMESLYSQAYPEPTPV